MTPMIPTIPQTRSSSKRRVSILGSTGSIGVQAMDVIAAQPEAFQLVALIAQQNWHLLAQQAIATRAQHVVVLDQAGYAPLKEALAGYDIEVSAGQQAVLDAASIPVDITLSATTGFAGLAPTLRAIEAGNQIALANKECLVAAGSVVAAALARYGTAMLPVDSEHNGLFQLWDEASRRHVHRVTLTASGGPFRDWSLEQLHRATAAEAVKHPNWSMGAKISVDSATLMNKGLELIEAHYLFALPPEQLGVLVHPQSIIHAMVSFTDGTWLAQMSRPDMRIPISQVLAWPERMPNPVPLLDPEDVTSLTFTPPDTKRFPALALAMAAMREGGAATTVLNAANEASVAAFLRGDIGFMDIPATVEAVMEQLVLPTPTSLEEAAEADALARSKAVAFFQKQKVAM